VLNQKLAAAPKILRQVNELFFCWHILQCDLLFTFCDITIQCNYFNTNPSNLIKNVNLYHRQYKARYTFTFRSPWKLYFGHVNMKTLLYPVKNCHTDRLVLQCLVLFVINILCPPLFQSLIRESRESDEGRTSAAVEIQRAWRGYMARYRHV